MKKFAKILRAILLVLIALVIVIVGTIGIVWRNEIGSVLGIKQIASGNEEHRDGNVYTIEYKGGYYFDDFLNQGGVSNDSELMNFVMKNITKGISIPGVVSAGCSSFNCATESGDMLFCRNFDLSKSNFAVVYTEPGNGRYASFSMVDLKYCGVSQGNTELGIVDKIKCLAAPYAPMDGMNEKGLACSIYICAQGMYTDESGSHTTKTNISTDKPDITSTTMLRMILDYASTVDEAIALVQQYDLHDSSTNAFHYSITDASGKTACLDWVYGTNETDLDGTNRTLCITYGDAENPLVIANFALAENYYKSDADKRGFDRYTDISDALRNVNNVVRDEEEAMDILKVAGRRTRMEAGLEEQSSALTLYSVVYNLTDKTVTLCANEHYGESEYTFTYDFQ